MSPLVEPNCSSAKIFLKAADMESDIGFPAYTPLTNGSMMRSYTSLPRCRVTNSFTDSSFPLVFGITRPIAPRPARMNPQGDRSLNLGMSEGPRGSAKSFPFQNTNLGSVWSASTTSSFKPRSTAILMMCGAGWNVFGPSSQVYPFSCFVITFPPILSLASVISTFNPFLCSANARELPETPLPTTSVSAFFTFPPSAAVALTTTPPVEERRPFNTRPRGPFRSSPTDTVNPIIRKN
mmetsp:Transcript_4644/g.19878  ORF Transcript_4644/g.19878 Transcript_4644/m.19878 type:complete len:237 (-) Transcript_4644:58-768(-)